MRIALLLILFYSLPAFSETLYKSRVHTCENEKGFKRRLEVHYQSQDSALPCRVVLFRGDVKDSGKEIVLYRAEHQVGKCEAQEEAYLNKLKKAQVRCESLHRDVAQVSTPADSDTNKSGVPAPASAPEEKIEKPYEDFARSHWERSYFGAVLGGEFGKSSSKSGSVGYNADNEKWDYNHSGLNVGAQMGYNRLWNRLVIGPEFELGYLGFKGDASQPDSPGGDTVGKIESDFYTALRLRVGADVGRNLFFGTLGVIGVNTKTQVVDNCNVAPCGGTTMDANKKSLEVGYTVGAGLEHMFENNWSLKFEYLYFDLGKKDFSGTTSLGDSYGWTSETTGNLVRFGLSTYY